MYCIQCSAPHLSKRRVQFEGGNGDDYVLIASNALHPTFPSAAYSLKEAMGMTMYVLHPMLRTPPFQAPRTE